MKPLTSKDNTSYKKQKIYHICKKGLSTDDDDDDDDKKHDKV